MCSQINDGEYLSRLRRRVEQEIETYIYDCPEDAIGKAWPQTRVDEGLAQFRAALVEPYWAEVEIRDTFDQARMTAAPRRQCAVVANDGKGVLLLFDPVEGAFVLAERHDTGLATFGVRGDAVGCFLAR